VDKNATQKTLYWVTKDLRLDDNPALLRAAQADRLLIVFCVEPQWFSARRYHLPSLGGHRWNFLKQSLEDLNRQLLNLGQRLLLVYERPELALPQLIERHSIGRLVCSRPFGSDEIETLAQIDKAAHKIRPGFATEVVDTYTLFSISELPFDIADWPPTYSRFRRQAEKLDVSAPLPRPDSLPAALDTVAEPKQRPGWVAKNTATDCPFQGGETAANEHLSTYFLGDLPLSYKEVRNALDGWDNSSKLSPWMNGGCLSTRRVKQVLSDYEGNRGSNESTHWLYVELLWREYFQWLTLKLGNKLFSFQGSAKRRPRTCFFPDRYQMWCAGSTPYPLVNACMRQLAATGYLSNRGRQIAASCCVNELGLDWRYGAAWFEHQLVDYDVGSNWGNWQYIAGVGADPRGGRHFNLDKQTQMFDADGSYRERWGGNLESLPLDSRDAADWPL